MSNGVFNVLLTDDGSPVTTPGTPSAASLRSAFQGTDRFLGLTITRTPGGAVSLPVEVLPRQQMVSSPFTLQAGQSTLADWATFATNAGTATYALSSGRDPFNATNGLNVAGPMVISGPTALNARVDLKGSSTTNGGFVPVGAILMFSGTVAPPGWALCDGGTYYGTKTPDLSGRFVLGMGQSPTTNRVLKATGGSETHTLTLAEMPSHTHAVNFKTFDYSAVRTDGERDVAGPDFDAWKTTNSFTSTSAGSTKAHDIMPPFYVLAYIMRVQ